MRILDFGLAAEIRSSMSRVSTETGDTSGTRPYMAPEQWLGRKQDGRTDQYALACVLYELLSGAPPFAGVFETGDPVIMRTAVTTDPPEEIEGCDPAVNAALLRALAKDPKERFGSCSEFVENCLAQRPQGGGGLEAAVSKQGGGGLQTAVSKQGEAGSPGVLAPPDAPAQEAEVLRRKVLMARTLKNLPSEDRSDAGLSAFAEEADMELETAEEAFRYARFAAAAQCLDRADAALHKLAQTKAERKARLEAERKAREERERKAREEAERKAKAEAERKAREEIERKAREEAERKAKAEADRRARKEKGMIQLWEGGPYWATKNIGAKKPENYGLYFWWGDTIGYLHENCRRKNWFFGDRMEEVWVASDGSSRNFEFAGKNAPTYHKDNATLRHEGWITEAGVLAPEHDAAHVYWGGDWRMPTMQELYDLGSKCDWTWITVNGVEGYVVKGRGAYADASIFLPAAGGGSGTSLRSAGSYGLYWSSVSDGSFSICAWDLVFHSGDHGTGYYDRYYGFPVRPVQGFAK